MAIWRLSGAVGDRLVEAGQIRGLQGSSRPKSRGKCKEVGFQ